MLGVKNHDLPADYWAMEMLLPETCLPSAMRRYLSLHTIGFKTLVFNRTRMLHARVSAFRKVHEPRRSGSKVDEQK